MAKPNLKTKILDAGLKVMLRKGFHAASVRDIVGEAGAPQGSFTNHFKSKEDFAAEVLELYFDTVRRRIAESLTNEALAPMERLRRYLELISDRLALDGFARGCLVGDFSLEVVQESEDLRCKLIALYDEWLPPFANCISQAQAAGEIDGRFAAEELAEFLLASWQGAILRMKVERSGEALERFKRIAFATVFSAHR